jgi:hypothetical protein
MLWGGDIIMLFSMQFLGRLAALAHDYRPGQRVIGSNIPGHAGGFEGRPRQDRGRAAQPGGGGGSTGRLSPATMARSAVLEESSCRPEPATCMRA